MSQFLPESAEFKLPGGPVSDADLQFVSRAFGNPNLIAQVAPQFLSYMVSYIEQAGLLIPASQVPGFNLFNAQSSTNNGAAYRNTNTYGDPTTGDAGPTVSGLPDGKYVLFYGALAWDFSGGGGTTYVSPKVNSTEAVTADAASTTANSSGISISRAVLKDLDAGENNTVTLRYNMSTGTGRWDNRFLICLRYSNL